MIKHICLKHQLLYKDTHYVMLQGQDLNLETSFETQIIYQWQSHKQT